MRMKESNILCVKEIFLHGILVETFVVMKSGNVSDTRWYKHNNGEKVPQTVHRFCAKRKAEVFSENEKMDIRKIIYRA